MNLSSRFELVLVCCLASLTAGCSTFQKKDPSSDTQLSLADRMPWSKAKRDKPPKPYPNPAKIAAVWSPETLTQAGRMPTRGFGARMFFYDEKSRPVPVEGTLIVHGFNEDSGSPQPEIKRYEFTPEQLTQHFSSSDLGASYSLWIPWDAVGGKQQRISLVASFKTAEGKLLQGSPTTVLLPGAKGDRDLELAERFSPEYRKWQAAASGNTPPTSGLTTTTIRRSPNPSAVSPIATPPISSSDTWNIARQQSGNSIDVAMRNRPRSKPMSTDAMPASAVLPKPTSVEPKEVYR